MNRALKSFTNTNGDFTQVVDESSQIFSMFFFEFLHSGNFASSLPIGCHEPVIGKPCFNLEMLFITIYHSSRPGQLTDRPVLSGEVDRIARTQASNLPRRPL